MLLGLSLTLLLLPWVSHHPEFLIAPFVLAVTPVVGNGVRPVLKEVAAGFVTTLRLMGMAAWFDITHELPAGQQQHQHSHGHSSSSSAGAPPPQQQYGRDVYQQQQAYQQMKQQQQPRPSGPHSPWPNPAYMPANWPPAQQQQQSQQPSAAAPPLSHPISADEAVDVDWAPRSPPDPHRCVFDPAVLATGSCMPVSAVSLQPVVVTLAACRVGRMETVLVSTASSVLVSCSTLVCRPL